jgi:hypothetical protein
LVRLVETDAPYWGAEAEVCRTYFESPRRTAETDCAWLASQAAKELVDGVMGRADELRRALGNDGGMTDVRLLTHLTEELHEEAVHYAAFAAAYEHLRNPGTPPLDAAALRRKASWPENARLRDMRARHRTEHGRLGELAGLVTEGGYCALFSEGARLTGRGGADDVIAEVCRIVLDDELEHMVRGVVGLRDAGLTVDDWDLLVQLTVDQLRMRIHMRQAQLGHPVARERLDVLLAGGGDSPAFRWELAGMAGAAP